MSSKIVIFGPIANDWLNGHPTVSETKIMTIVRHKSGDIQENDDGSYTLSTFITYQGKQLKIFIKVRDIDQGYYVELFVIKIHSGGLRKNARL